MAELSVVVPFFNVEAYIGAALDSIARQTLRDIEVIMVDDGSADGSAVIAKSFAARDPRFRLVQQANQGLGSARNTGAQHATGRYLAFADSDDLLDPHAYELLVGSLRKTGSDIACGGVLRFSSTGTERSWLHDELFRTTVRRTHVSRRPMLLRDRTAWNKVFRRSFWDEHGLRFPGSLYEDGPVTLRAHVLASSVDILGNVVYYWRMRDSGELSITQRARDVANIAERMASVGAVGEFLAANAPQLKPGYDESVLNVDLGMLLRAYELASEPDRVRLAELAAGYLSTVDEPVYRTVTALRRLQCHLLRTGMRGELLEVLRYARRGDDGEVQLVRGSGRRPRWHAAFPYFRDPARAIPDEVYDVTAEMTLFAQLDAVSWRAGRLRVEGHAYINQLALAARADGRIRVRLRNSKTRRTIRLPVERICRPDVTARSEQTATCYDWSGFAVEVAPRWLATAPRIWRAANWELEIEVSAPGMRRAGPVSAVALGSACWPPGRWIGRDIWIQAAADEGGRFFVRGRRVDGFVTACRASGDYIEIEGWTRPRLAADAELVISPQKGGGEKIRVPVEAAAAGPAPGSGRAGFRARLPVPRLAELADAAFLDQALHVHDEITWDVSVAAGAGGPALRLTVAPGTTGVRVRDGSRETTAIGTRYGYFSVLARTVRPVVTDVQWSDDGRVVLRGDHTDPAARPTGLLLRHSKSGEQSTIPLTWSEGGFSAEFAPARMPGPAGELPLASGSWNLLARSGDGWEVAVPAARNLLPDLPGYRRVGSHRIEPQPYRTDALRFEVRPDLADDERGGYAQRRLRTIGYPAARTGTAVRELAVFASFGGRQYSCNPRAIYEQLSRDRPDLDCAWITADGQFGVPAGARVVLADSRAHFDALARARYVITNDMLPRWFRRRPGQMCLQTWHGTPLKRIGLDIDRPQFSSGLIYPDLLRADVANWDLLLSPNAFSSPIFARAFGFDGEIMESGYPRNDLLHCGDQAARAAAVRRQLGLPTGKRVVLYAPTWRDDAYTQLGQYRSDLRLDLAAVARALGDEAVLLLRLHTNVRRGAHIASPDQRVIDVTRYPDITDLYLVSDVLITDYSSVMFDFAGTGRPILFFTYDLERYRDQLRGFYFDLAADAPGPLLRTGDEVIEALRDIDQVSRSYQRAYQAFSARFCALDDGRAAMRVVQRIAGR
jgi:CDP-glycerol glycerophosphotransferase